MREFFKFLKRNKWDVIFLAVATIAALILAFIDMRTPAEKPMQEAEVAEVVEVVNLEQQPPEAMPEPEPQAEPQARAELPAPQPEATYQAVTNEPTPAGRTYTESDIDLMAKMVWGEARGCTVEEQRLVVWTVLQRVDTQRWGKTIEAVITAKHQFVGYRQGNPINAEIRAMCATEMENWRGGAEPPTHEVYAPTAPYYYFDGRGGNNWFRAVWR